MILYVHMTRETLSREQIIKASIYLLDSKGVKGLSMRRLGEVLGGATTATYWHVKNKESLLVLAADQVWGEVTLPDYTTLGWQKAAQTFARDTFSLIIHHPWLMTAMIDHGAYGVNRASCQNHYYAILEEAGFKGMFLDAAVNTLLTFTFGTAFADSMNGEQAERLAADFPLLQASVTGRIGMSAEALRSSNFEFGLTTILEGFSVQVKE